MTDSLTEFKEEVELRLIRTRCTSERDRMNRMLYEGPRLGGVLKERKCRFKPLMT